MYARFGAGVAAHEVQGAEGLADRRLGRLLARRAPVDQVMQVLGLFETRYVGFLRALLGLLLVHT
jgi:hypothetical protein